MAESSVALVARRGRRRYRRASAFSARIGVALRETVRWSRVHRFDFLTRSRRWSKVARSGAADRWFFSDTTIRSIIFVYDFMAARRGSGGSPSDLRTASPLGDGRIWKMQLDTTSGRSSVTEASKRRKSPSVSSGPTARRSCRSSSGSSRRREGRTALASDASGHRFLVEGLWDRFRRVPQLMERLRKEFAKECGRTIR
jgi:hypothetical protein